MAEIYRRLTRILRDHGFVLKRQGKGDHELWWNPVTGKHALVDAGSTSRITANAVLRRAGLPKAF